MSHEDSPLQSNKKTGKETKPNSNLVHETKFDTSCEVLGAEKIVFCRENIAFNRDSVAPSDENLTVGRGKGDRHSRLTALRSWDYYLTRQPLIKFVSRNMRDGWRLERKRAVYLREKCRHFQCLFEKLKFRISRYVGEKRRHTQYLLGKLRFKSTQFWLGIVVWLRHIVRAINVAWLRTVVHPLRGRLNIWLERRLGTLEQYHPRTLRLEVYPSFNGERDRLPSMAIVTPSYNQAAFLDRTIQSVITQGYPDLEYAIIDGGSTDGSTEILAKYRSHLAYAVSEADQGQAHAIIKGFSKTDGEIMAYLNSDDCLMPGALRYIGDYFRRHPEVDVVYGHRVIIDEDGLEVGRWVIPPHDAECVRRFDYIPQETLFWRRHFYEKVGGLDARLHFALDWDLILKFMRAGARFRRLPYFIACFRMHCAQKTSFLLESIGRDENGYSHGTGISSGGSPEGLVDLSRSLPSCFNVLRIAFKMGNTGVTTVSRPGAQCP